MRRLFTAVALAAGILLPAAGATGAFADSHDHKDTGIGIRLVDAPVATADDPRAMTYVIDHLAPGDVIERRLEVTNDNPSTSQVSMYPAAASIQDGVFVGNAGRTRSELSTWTSTRPRELALEPQEDAFVTVTIRVPDDAAPGERYGVVWAESTADKGSITQVNRVGIRLYLSVGPGGAPASDFAIESIAGGRDNSGAPLVSAEIHNTGGRALDLRGELSLTDGPGGLSAGPFDATLGTTLGLDQTAPLTVPLDEALPDGPWKATLTVQSGLTERTASATITFPESGMGPAVTPDDGLAWWVYAAGAAALLLLLMLVWWLLARQRRRHSAGPAQEPGAPALVDA